MPQVGKALAGKTAEVSTVAASFNGSRAVGVTPIQLRIPAEYER